MAKYGSDDVAFWLVDGHSLAPLLSDITLDGPEALLEETHGFSEAWVKQSPVGLQRWAMTQNGWIDDDTDASLDAISGQDGAERVMCFCVKGGAAGSTFDGVGGAMQARHQHILSRGALSKISASFSGSGAYDEDGIILHALAAETADGDSESSAHDGAAQSTAGGAAYLQVTALTLGGYDNVTIRVLDSADNTTFAELAAFAAVTAAPDAERVAVSGTVERYLACDWEFDGTGSNPSVTFMAGFARY